MLSRAGISRLAAIAGFVLCGIAPAWADTLVMITSPSGQSANDTLKWSQLGPNGTVLGSNFSATSVGGFGVSGTLAGSNSLVSVVCPASPCSWTGGFSATDSLLWTSDAGNSGNGPVTLAFATAITGVGAFIQANAPGQFTAQIQAFNGATLLQTFTAMSDSAGDPVYIGTQDQSGPNITKVVFSLTACGPLDTSGCTDFAVDMLNLNAGPAIASIAVRSLNFGIQPKGLASAPQTAVFANVGGAFMNITGAGAAGGNSGDFSVSRAACPAQLAPGGNCLLSVTFTPTAGGPRRSSISVSSNAGSGPATTILTGVGTSAGFVPTSLSFSAQPVGTTSAAKPVMLENLGSVTLNVFQVAVLGTNAADFSITGNTCGAPIVSLATCMVSVVFKPTATGAHSAFLLFSDDGGGSPQFVTLSGTGQ